MATIANVEHKLPSQVLFKAPPPAFSDIAKASNDVGGPQTARCDSER